MGSISAPQKPHAVLVPFPAQGHVTPVLNLAKLLHFKGFHITFVNTEYNHRRLLRAKGVESLDILPSFQFKAIPDGLPETDGNCTQHVPSLCDSTARTCLEPFKKLIAELNDTATSNVPPVSCIICDGVMSFTLDAAEELGIPQVALWTTSSCGFLAYLYYRQLIDRGYTPLKDESYLSNGYLDTVIDWIPGLPGITLKDMPSFIRTTDPKDIMLNFFVAECERAQKASAIIINTYDALESDTLAAISSIMAPPIYSIGPLHLLRYQVTDPVLQSIGSNLWIEEDECFQWLDTKEADSVVFVNFGCTTTMTKDQLIEFAWGLANSKQTFLWIIRPDIVAGESALLPENYVEVTKERGILASWCNQEKVLRHPSIGAFLTHSGWNSTIESISGGVPVICWPFFAEQQTNCRFCRVEWGIGMEINSDVKRHEVEGLVRELMEGEKGKAMRKKAEALKEKAEEAVAGPNGSSYQNLDKIIDQVLLSSGYTLHGK